MLLPFLINLDHQSGLEGIFLLGSQIIPLLLHVSNVYSVYHFCSDQMSTSRNLGSWLQMASVTL